MQLEFDRIQLKTICKNFVCNLLTNINKQKNINSFYNFTKNKIILSIVNYSKMRFIYYWFRNCALIENNYFLNLKIFQNNKKGKIKKDFLRMNYTTVKCAFYLIFSSMVESTFHVKRQNTRESHS